MTSIRPMQTTDIPFGMHLVQQAGWNQLETDWQRALALHPGGCFVAEHNGNPAGTVTTCVFGSVAWIAMMLVDTAARGQGIGKSLMEHAMAHLDHLGVATQRLDATDLGKPLYEKLGFAAEYEVVRLKGIAKPTAEADATRWTHDTRDQPILDLDSRVTGGQRGAFLHALAENNPFFHSIFDDELAYAGSRKGRNAIQLGPAVASTPEAGSQLCDALLAHFSGMPVFMDIPVPNKPALRWAKAHGLEEQRRFTRMYRGEKPVDHPEMIWASSGPEKG